MNNPIKSFLRLVIYIIIGVSLSSCSDDDDKRERETQNTIFMYLPWSNNLTDCFDQNIKDMESGICQMGGLSDDRLIVYMSTSPTNASMYEIVYKNGKCSHVTIETFTNYPFTTVEGLTSLLLKLKKYAPANNYSMIIGGHGMGWLPVETAKAAHSRERFHYEYDNGPLLTRFFGGKTAEFQTDISTLADALGNAGMKLRYILFDNCYMANVEVAYELKDVTGHIIASTCEIVSYGMPYANVGRHLFGHPDYKAVCNEFHKFYTNYGRLPYGTLSVTDCSQLDGLAAVMKRINATCRFDEAWSNSIQTFDGYTPAIFFDYGDYVTKLLKHNNADIALADAFARQLALTVPIKTNTDNYYTTQYGDMPINAYSGMTTSDPSKNTHTIGKVSTKWYKATH